MARLRSTRRAASSDSIAANRLVSPLLGNIAGGDPIDDNAGDLGEIVFDLSAMGIRPKGKTFALKVEGDSMIGAGINDGDVVVIEKRPHRSGNIVAALVDGRVTLKRFIIQEDARQLLRAENKSYRDIVIGEESHVQGVAIAVVHELPT